MTTLPPLSSHELDVRFSAPARTAEGEPAPDEPPTPLVRLVGMDVPATTVTSGDPIASR